MPVRNGSPEGSYSLTGPNYRRARDKGTGKRGPAYKTAMQCWESHGGGHGPSVAAHLINKESHGKVMALC